MPTLIVHDRARQDLTEITDFIAQDNLRAALRVYDAIEQSFKFLSETPGAGTRLSPGVDPTHELRFWPVKKFRNYLVIYRALTHGVEVVRVIHGARDLAKALRHP